MRNTKTLIDNLKDGIAKYKKETGEDLFAVTIPVVDIMPKLERLVELESRVNEGWIPCSERLPEEDTWCLATAYNESQKQRFVGEVYYSDGSWNDVYYDDIIVSAWMPVPEPYKEE